jgi:predicted GNAT superfamily acetyltransferase
MNLGYMSCRRTKYVQAAYVEAAVHINKVYGSDRAYWILIREKIPQAVIERVLRGDPGRVRRKDRRYATRRALIQEPIPTNNLSDLRKDHLTSQRVEVALVFEAMLGLEAAKEYLHNASVPIWVSERVLSSTHRRPSPELVIE